MNTIRIVLLASLLFTLPVSAAQTLSVGIQRLTMESALTVARAAIDSCRKKGIQVAAVVVDRGGNVQVALRDTVAVDLTLRIAREKAYTALSFNVPTSSMTSRSASALGQLDGLVMAAGGLPIQAGGVNYGAVGVSGAPSGEQDEACAAAGVQLIVDELEMAQ